MDTGGGAPGASGISRSGRVRKKSTKLADFQSPEEIEPRPRRKSDKSAPSVGGGGSGRGVVNPAAVAAQGPGEQFLEETQVSRTFQLPPLDHWYIIFNSWYSVKLNIFLVFWRRARLKDA